MLIPYETVVTKCKPVTGILHVGAHHAEELPCYNQFGVPLTVWVEADPRLAAGLEQVVCRPPRHRVIWCAATNIDGPVRLRVTSNGGMSSSLLPLKGHLIRYPDITESEQIEVPGRRLGPLMDELGIPIGAPGLNLLNLDIQGAELLALEGLGDKVGKFNTIYMEVNTQELYEGCAQLPDVDVFLGKFGFVRIMTVMWADHGWGDALYINQTAL